jgi:hypothetical protein
MTHHSSIDTLDSNYRAMAASQCTCRIGCGDLQVADRAASGGLMVLRGGYQVIVPARDVGGVGKVRRRGQGYMQVIDQITTPDTCCE